MTRRQLTLIVAEGFDDFWADWPKKVAKKEAQKAWNEIGPDVALRARIKAAIAWQRHQPGWVKDGGQYVPHAATWLRAARWEDEPFFTSTLPPRPPKPASLQVIDDMEARRHG